MRPPDRQKAAVESVDVLSNTNEGLQYAWAVLQAGERSNDQRTKQASNQSVCLGLRLHVRVCVWDSQRCYAAVLISR